MVRRRLHVIYGSVCFVLLQVKFGTGQPLFLLSPGVVALARLALVEHPMVVCVMCVAAYAVCRGRVNPVCSWFAPFCGLEELHLACIQTSKCSLPPLVSSGFSSPWPKKTSWKPMPLPTGQLPCHTHLHNRCYIPASPERPVTIGDLIDTPWPNTSPRCYIYFYCSRDSACL